MVQFYIAEQSEEQIAHCPPPNFLVRTHLPHSDSILPEMVISPFVGSVSRPSGCRVVEGVGGLGAGNPVFDAASTKDRCEWALACYSSHGNLMLSQNLQRK